MNILSKITDVILKNSQRVIQVMTYGKMANTATEVGPWGIDSAPIKGSDAIYAGTLNIANNVILGYPQGNKKAAPGEFRCFATDADGNVVIDMYMRNDGTMEIGGSANHMTQFEALQIGLNTYFSNLNTAISAGIASAGGTYTPPAALNITAAKLTNIKTS